MEEESRDREDWGAPGPRVEALATGEEGANSGGRTAADGSGNQPKKRASVEGLKGESSSRRGLGWKLAGWSLHLYTASGAVFGLLALFAIQRRSAEEALLWMLVAAVIDSTDGAIARWLDVRRLIPSIDGRRLDDVVDYFTYVVVPIVFLVTLDYLPGHWWLVAPPLIASGFGFANTQAKTEDDFFLGFPSYWNVVALYIWLFRLPAPVNGVIVTVLAILVLVPIRYVYPSKTRPLRPVTVLLCGFWGVQLLLQFTFPDRMPSWWMYSSLHFPVYYLGLSFALHWGWLSGRRVSRGDPSVPFGASRPPVENGGGG